MEFNKEFWEALERLVGSSEIIIDRPKGTAHPRYPSFIYPVDYGYLRATSSMDGGGIDVFRGSAVTESIDAVLCTVDLMKRDSEIKILIACTDEEKKKIFYSLNNSDYMKCILIRRG